MEFELVKKTNNKRTILLKRILLPVVIICLILVLIVIKRNNIFKSNNMVANSDKLVVKEIKVNDFDEITVVSARIEKLGNSSSIYVKVQNNTQEDIEKCDLKLTVKDKDNNIVTISYIIDFEDLKIGELREFQVSTEDDLSTATTYEVEKVKE